MFSRFLIDVLSWLVIPWVLMVLLFTLVYLSFENPVTKHILLGITPLVI